MAKAVITISLMIRNIIPFGNLTIYFFSLCVIHYTIAKLPVLVQEWTRDSTYKMRKNIVFALFEKLHVSQFCFASPQLR